MKYRCFLVCASFSILSILIPLTKSLHQTTDNRINRIDKIGLKADCFTRDNMKKQGSILKTMIDYCSYMCTKLKQL